MCILYFLMGHSNTHSIQTCTFSRAHISAQGVAVISHIFVRPDTMEKNIDYHSKGNLSWSK